jgi:hypothetical protein
MLLGRSLSVVGYSGLPDRLLSSMASSLEAFSYNPTDGSFAPPAFQPSALPIIRMGGSSRTKPNYSEEAAQQ